MLNSTNFKTVHFQDRLLSALKKSNHILCNNYNTIAIVILTQLANTIYMRLPIDLEKVLHDNI